MPCFPANARKLGLATSENLKESTRKETSMTAQRIPRLAAAAAGILVLLLSPALLSADPYFQTNLTSDVPGLANVTDPNLVNPWGMAFSATSPFWVADQGVALSTLYNGTGAITPIVVSIPGGPTPPFGPTGVVNNSTTGFALPGGAAAHFIFDTLNGTIAAWASGTAATTMVTTPGAIYTGLALGASGGNSYLYAANSIGSINVFDSSFNNVTATTFAGKFVDPSIPAGYVPYNIQLIGSNLYVTYADLLAHGVPAPGSTGYVDVYDTSGNLLQQLVAGGALDAPWGITLAPAGFGAFGNDILVGNFGNGEIDAYNATTGAYKGTIDGENGMPLVNQDLWALDFRTGGASSTSPNALYFTAGIDNQTEGLFGEIAPTPEPAPILLAGLGVLALALFRATRKMPSTPQNG
jgi:uncharacterized protein (TIGR03118 family)